MPGDPDARTIDFSLPPLPRWVRNLIIGLFALYVLELVAENFLHVPLWETLGWWPARSASFAAWQPITHWLVQGPEAQNVLFSLLALYFTLPPLESLMSRRTMSQALLAAAIGGLVFGFALDLLGVVVSPGFGWAPFALASFALFGLAYPTGTVRLYFVLPVPARWIAWGTGIFAAVLLLAYRTLGTADSLGAWAGVTAWWFWIGPGARTRRLRAQGKAIERELSKFQVLPGGREKGRGEKGRGGNRPNDDVVN